MQCAENGLLLRFRDRVMLSPYAPALCALHGMVWGALQEVHAIRDSYVAFVTWLWNVRRLGSPLFVSAPDSQSNHGAGARSCGRWAA